MGSSCRIVVTKRRGVMGKPRSHWIVHKYNREKSSNIGQIKIIIAPFLWLQIGWPPVFRSQIFRPQIFWFRFLRT